MKWRLAIILILIFNLTSCLSGLDIKNVENENGDVENISQIDEFKIGDVNNGLTPIDFDAVYLLCTSFLEDFHYKTAASSNENNVDIDYFFNNELLKEYTYKKIEFGKINNEIIDINIGLVDINWNTDNEAKYVYLDLVVVLNMSYGGENSSRFQFLVTEDEGRLYISDWYYPFGGGVAYLDEIARPYTHKLVDPYIWDDIEWANSVIEKANEALKNK